MKRKREAYCYRCSSLASKRCERPTGAEDRGVAVVTTTCGQAVCAAPECAVQVGRHVHCRACFDTYGPTRKVQA